MEKMQERWNMTIPAVPDNVANMCAKVTSTYMEFTLAFGPKPEFSFSFKLNSPSSTGGR